MPKEQINRQKRYKVVVGAVPDKDGLMTSGEEFDGQDPIVNVNWLKSDVGAGHVQISIDVPMISIYEAADANRAAVGDGVASSSLVWTPPLERDEINKMIRILRHARDQALGADA